MRDNNIVPSIGHSAAPVEVAKEHVEAGAMSVTHFDNAITKIAEAEDGLAGYVLGEDRLYKEMIFDGIHVKQELMERVVATVPQDKLIMVTDALHIAGMPNGEYENLNGTVLVSKDGVGYNSEGILNGSARTFIQSFKFAMENLNLDLPTLQRISSTNAAEMLKLNKGLIKEGYDADIIMLDDNYDLVKTIVMGEEK
jgi:N-acetylglucosamine-6-phosphate deacetylase